MNKRPQRTARGDSQQSWFAFRNVAGEDGLPAELWIYDEIGHWGVTAANFTDELRAVKAKAIDVRLNSPGGDVFDGIAIHNAIQRHPARVTMHVDALAASAASFVAMAGDEIVIDRHAQMMIHDAMGFMFGNAAVCRKYAAELERASDTIANIYAERTGVEAAFWRMAMVDETWYNAAEAAEVGLADRVATRAGTRASARPPAGVPATARWDLAVYNYAGRSAAPAPKMPDSRARAKTQSDPLADLLAMVDRECNTASKVDAASDPLAALKGA